MSEKWMELGCAFKQLSRMKEMLLREESGKPPDSAILIRNEQDEYLMIPLKIFIDFCRLFPINNQSKAGFSRANSLPLTGDKCLLL